MLEKLDGSTAGPRAFTGEIGKALNNCQILPIAEFKSIDCEEMPIILQLQDLSCDQSYLYDMCKAVQTGNYLKKKINNKLSNFLFIVKAMFR